MHLDSWESTREAREALSFASSHSNASLVLSQLPACIMQYLKYKFLASPQSQYALSMFLNFGLFSSSCSCKKGSYKKECNLCGETIKLN